MITLVNFIMAIRESVITVAFYLCIKFSHIYMYIHVLLENARVLGE